MEHIVLEVAHLVTRKIRNIPKLIALTTVFN